MSQFLTMHSALHMDFR